MTNGMKRSIHMRLGRFATAALHAGEGNGGEPLPEDVVRAIRFYLNDKGSREAGWHYPAFMRDRQGGEEVELELSVDEAFWRSVGEEAASQSVSVRQLVEHASLYYAAEIDAGRVTERILEDLTESGEG